MELKSKVSGILMMIVGLIIVISVIGATAGTVNTASTSINVSNRCVAAGCFWNSTVTTCYNASGFLGNCGNSVAAGTLPLEGLFNSGGVVLLIFIGAGLLMVIGLLMAKSRWGK